MTALQNKLVSITLFCAVFCFGWSVQDKNQIRIPAPLVLTFRQQAEICGKENGVPPSYLAKIIDKTLPSDSSSLQFYKCMGLNTGYLDQDGHFVLDKFTNFEVVTGSAEDYVNKIKECNKIVKEDSLKTLDAASACLHEGFHFSIVKPN